MTRHVALAAGLLCAGVANAALTSYVPSAPGTGVAGTEPRLNEYVRDDGTAENSVGLTAGGNIVFLNRHTVTGLGAQLLQQIRIAFGTPTSLNGRPIIVGAWADNGANRPGALLTSMNGTVSNASAGVPINSPIYNVFDVPDVNLGPVGTAFYIGFIMNGQPSSTFPGAIDQTASQANSYAGFNTTTALDPNNLNTGVGANWGTIDSFGLPGNWLIRGDATVVPTPGAAALLGLAGLAGLRRRR